MEIKTVEDVVKAHNEFAQRVQKRVEALSGGKPSEAPAEEKVEEINLFRGKLKEITATRDEAIRRYDDEIRRLKASITHLEKEIKGSGKGPEKSAPGTRPDSNRAEEGKPVRRKKQG
jgi:hypothetical protein